MVLLNPSMHPPSSLANVCFAAFARMLYAPPSCFRGSTAFLDRTKDKGAHEPKAQTAGAYTGFRSMRHA